MAKEDTLLPASEAPSRFLAGLSGNRSEPWLRGLARRLALSRLQKIEQGRLVVLEGDSQLEFGTAEADFPVSARVVIHHGAFWEQLAWGGSVGAGEAYCDGLWSTPDLTDVVRVLARNRDAMDEFDQGTARITAPVRWLLHKLRGNSRAGSLRNISAHYDTGNEFFSQFLDPTLTYSCAIFPDALSTLETAQQWKLDTICQKLELDSNDRLVEIGTGWGSLAIHAARKYGCDVVTTTISEEQFRYASQAVADAGLAGKVTVLKQDYRGLPATLVERFDKLVSVEMIEAVGHAYLPRYLEVLGQLVKPDGLALIQAILIPDQRYESYRRSVDFIQHYIFPGGLLPSLGRIQQCMMNGTDLRLVDLEDLTPHYARTLVEWRRRFSANEDKIAALGLSEAERRKWKFYFSYCEGGFLERTVAGVQLLLAKPDNRRDSAAAGLLRKPN
ncbi:MAG: cyclopropane-fatty-acyl-phospholipid synthase family protein [Thermoanaerobaculia bacterium]